MEKRDPRKRKMERKIAAKCNISIEEARDIMKEVETLFEIEYNKSLNKTKESFKYTIGKLVHDIRELKTSDIQQLVSEASEKVPEVVMRALKLGEGPDVTVSFSDIRFNSSYRHADNYLKGNNHAFIMEITITVETINNSLTPQ